MFIKTFSPSYPIGQKPPSKITTIYIYVVLKIITYKNKQQNKKKANSFRVGKKRR